MDGFESDQAVVVLGATNRPEILDPALLRPGRFDRRVAVQPPDKAGRAKILEVHTRSMPLDDDVDLEALAATTPGMVGADLANLATRRRCWRRGATTTRSRWLTSPTRWRRSCSAPRAGSSSAPRIASEPPITSPATRWWGCSRPDADPVRKISIIPRGMALGVTLSTPDADRVSYSREELDAKIKVALGGRVAEEVVYGKITTGAESDIQQLTHIARQMVGRWGMSDKVGPIAVLPSDGPRPFLPGASETSPETQWLVDHEVQHIVERAHAGHPIAHRPPRPARQPRAAAQGRDARRRRRLRCRRSGETANRNRTCDHASLRVARARAPGPSTRAEPPNPGVRSRVMSGPPDPRA